MDIIDNCQSDDITTGLDPENNQQASQQESVTELTTVVPISYHSRGFSMEPLTRPAGKHTLAFFRTFVMARRIVGAT